MEALTIREAAERAGTTPKAVQRKVERGTLRSVLRGGRRLIPVAELERAGMVEGTGGEPSPQAGQMGELLDRLEWQAAELGRLRQIEAVAGAAEAALHEQRALRLAAEQRLERLAVAGWRQRRRLLRELRDT